MEEKKLKRNIKEKINKKVNKIKHEKSQKDEYKFNLLEVCIIIFITTVIVCTLTLLVATYTIKNSNNTYKPLNTDLKEFNEVYEHIINNYVEDINKKELIDSAIEGMYDYLSDEYSIYMDEDYTNDLSEQLNGEYKGIGVEIYTSEENNKTKIIVNRVFKNSPAEKANLKPGDIILELDGVNLENKDSSYVSETIKKGEKNEYSLKILRDSKEINIQLKRENVTIESVTSSEFDNIGYIKLETFSLTTSNQVKDVLRGFSDKIDTIIIDLRDNTGGYLNSAYEIADLFVEKGKNIYQLKDKENRITIEKAQNDVFKNYKNIVVLINGYSASASEVLTLALRESANAKVVGTKSFGKGTVQETKPLSSGAMVKVTTAYWLSPNGESINKTGIIPDYIEEEINKQLEKAKEIANK